MPWIYLAWRLARCSLRSVGAMRDAALPLQHTSGTAHAARGASCTAATHQHYTAHSTQHAAHSGSGTGKGPRCLCPYLSLRTSPVDTWVISLPTPSTGTQVHG
ncbi:hypothetical protein E2C01_097685 [Portunus trituberculatus]|uniref:Uncharacterized protein n=1 Tax=Portunus trituberculatus TaxID=210409 RepID=A0A5B7K5H1_PORTR|nr:hypothetical protein [Portunus trituberculatus]